jgi:ribosomal protein L11 methyltransferase
MTVMDVGTGSGVLAKASALLGAAPVWACDIDPVAVGIAHASGSPDVFVGSVDAVRSGCTHLITANISAEAIAQLAPELLRCLRPGGAALVSGFERQETAAVQACLERHGGAVVEFRCKGNWVLLAVTRKPVRPQSPAHPPAAD